MRAGQPVHAVIYHFLNDYALEGVFASQEDARRYIAAEEGRGGIPASGEWEEIGGEWRLRFDQPRPIQHYSDRRIVTLPLQ